MSEASPPAPLRRRIAGSFLSALIGWFMCQTYMLPLMLGTRSEWLSFGVYSPSQGGRAIFNETWSSATFSSFVVEGVITGVLIFVVWLFILLPLYLFVPLRSIFWRSPVCTICGAISGTLFMAIFNRATWPPTVPFDFETYVPFYIVAALVGAATCLFASLTRRYFQYAADDSEK